MKEDMMRKGGLAKGLLIGGLVGAAAGLMFAPKSGRELRSDLKSRYREAQDKTMQAASDIAGKAREVAKEAGQHASELVNKTMSAASSAKEEFQSWKKENADSGNNVN